MALPIVLGAIDAARGNVHAVIEDAAIARGEPAVVAGAHRLHLTMNAALLAFETRGLTTVELAGADTVGDASLLVELTLGERGLRCGRGRALSERHGRRCDQELG